MRRLGASTQRLRANRTNARASTGPRTAIGKARASRNSHKHGLSVPVGRDPQLASLASALANELAGPDATFSRQDLARKIAEAQIELVRVRRAREAFLRRELRELSMAQPTEGSSSVADMAPMLSKHLMALDRYERRALSRRKFLIRQFDQTCPQSDDD